MNAQDSAAHPHWAVRMNWKNRSLCFVLLGLTVISHLQTAQISAWVWAVWGLQFFLYPHLLYWHGYTAAQPRKAEVRNMLLDAVCFGAWAAALGFPLWLSFAMFAGASINLLAFGSWRGWTKAILAMAIGAITVMVLLPWSFQPDTSLLTSSLSMLTLMLFLAVYAQDGYLRATMLYQQRTQVRAQLEEIQTLKDSLLEQVSRDVQTGLFNRRMLEQKLPQLLQQSQERGTGLVLMLLDIDFFKDVNDSHGHRVGDQLLQALAHHLRHFSRPQDWVFRYGGDEFLVLYPDTPLAVAQSRAKELCDAFANNPRRLEQHTLQCTLSCGLAAFPQHGQTMEQLLECTDQALYCAKQAGRNRVAVFSHAPEQVPTQGSAPALAPSKTPSTVV